MFLKVPIQIEAAQGINKESAKKIVEQMENYESYILSKYNGISAKKTIKMTNNQKAVASALCIKVTNTDGLKKSEFGNYEVFKISNNKLKKKTKILFGKSIDKKALKIQADGKYIYDAYRLKDGTPVVFYMDGETETDYVKHTLKVKKKELQEI